MRSFGRDGQPELWKRIISRITPEILFVLYLLGFLYFRQPEEKWDRVISSDGKGYYAYLPALFIYHDLSFGFVEDYESKYYPENRMAFKEFRITVDGKTANKCFPGMALLLLPFFLIAHLLSHLLGMPADGYSLIYQYSVAVAALFYFWLSCRILMKLLIQLGASPMMAAFITSLIALGTNLIFFTVIESSMSHLFSFFLITLFTYITFCLFSSGKSFWIIPGMIILTLIVLVRPTNGLVVMFVPALARLIPGNTLSMIRGMKSFQRSFLISLIIPAILIFITLWMWHFQTGKWIIYSYGTETFDFTNPRFFSILFSFNRGWFIYTPIALLAIGGFLVLWKRHRKSFYWLSSFLVIYIYVLSSWWMWYYASKCGQRVFIDIYVLIALLLFFLFSGKMSQNVRWLLKGITMVLLLFNLFQFYQHARFIFPPQYITSEIYFDSFTRVYPRSKVFIPDQMITGRRTILLDMEGDLGWSGNQTKSTKQAFGGIWSSRIDNDHIYSAGFTFMPDSVFSSPVRILKVSAMVYQENSRLDSPMVIDFQSGLKSISYNPFFYRDYMRDKRWINLEFALYLPDDLPPDAVAKIYFYIPKDGEVTYIDDFKAECLSLKNDYGSRHIEGICLPCREKL